MEIFTKSDAGRVCSGVFSTSLMSVKGEITLGFWSLLRSRENLSIVRDDRVNWKKFLIHVS